MPAAEAAADQRSVSLRTLLALLGAAGALAVVAGESTTASAGSRLCASGDGGYTYAGHQARARGHGVRARITLTSAPRVEAGHVSGWVGLGGPGQGADGEDAWIQVGVAAMHGLEPFLYAEITRDGRKPSLIVLDRSVKVGESRDVGVLEVAGGPGTWRVWVDGSPATAPVRLRGSSGRWAPIATAESWNGGESACNGFAYRFERVSVAHRVAGSWKPLVSGYRFLDRGYDLRALGNGPLPYAFVASS